MNSLTTQTHIALQLVGTLSKEELEVFANEFNKLKIVQATPKPKKSRPVYNIPPTEKLMELIVQKHRLLWAKKN